MKEFHLSNAISIVNRLAFDPKPLDDNQVQMLMSGVGHKLTLEPVTLEEIENTYTADLLVEDNLLLSAITTKNNRLKKTMEALVREINKSFTGNLEAGAEHYSLISERLKGHVIPSAIISNPRKAGQYAIITALIPISDGQSVSVIFYAPDDDPLKINDTDTLIAFRFLLNKRDVTHIVAPVGGKDISLRQTCFSIAQAVEKNSEKFQANSAKAKAEKKALEQISEQIENTLSQAHDVNEQIESLTQTLSDNQTEIDLLTPKISRLTQANKLLEADIKKLKSQKASSTENSDQAQSSKAIQSIFKKLKARLKRASELGDESDKAYEALNGEMHRYSDDNGNITNRSLKNRLEKKYNSAQEKETKNNNIINKLFLDFIEASGNEEQWNHYIKSVETSLIDVYGYEAMSEDLGIELTDSTEAYVSTSDEEQSEIPTEQRTKEVVSDANDINQSNTVDNGKETDMRQGEKNATLDKHLDTLESIANGALTIQESTTQLTEIGAYFVEKDIMEEYAEEINSASDTVTKLIQEAFKKTLS